MITQKQKNLVSQKNELSFRRNKVENSYDINLPKSILAQMLKEVKILDKKIKRLDKELLDLGGEPARMWCFSSYLKSVFDQNKRVILRRR